MPGKSYDENTIRNRFAMNELHDLDTLAKVSGRNSFRANQNYSDSFRHLYPSQCESFQTNSKSVL